MIDYTGKYVLVTTEFRGVFMGKLVEKTASTVTLREVQMCTVWSTPMHGVFGLAAQGPDSDCKIGPPVPETTLRKWTSIATLTTEAVSKWKAEPWS